MDKLHDANEQGRLSRFLFVGWLLMWLSLQISGLPVTLALKNRFHLGAADISLFSLVTGIAWFLKPVFGWLSDGFPLWGTRRRHYLLLSSFLSGVVWCVLAVLPISYTLLLIAFTLINAGKTLASTVLGGIMVDAGQKYGTTGRLSAQRSAVTSAVALISGPVAGFLAGRAFGWAAVASAACAFGLTLLCYRLYHESRGGPEPSRGARKGISQYRVVLKSRSLWWGLLMSFLFLLAPGFGTPLLFVQQDSLHFSAQFIGNLALLSGSAGLLGAFVYSRLCRRLSIRVLLVGGTLIEVCAVLLFLRYDSALSAILITVLTGFTGAMAGLPVADLTARATPRGSEALGFSLMISASNVAWKFSDVLGSWLYQHRHFHFPWLVLLNAGTTLAMLLILPFVPRSLTDQSEKRSQELPGS